MGTFTVGFKLLELCVILSKLSINRKFKERFCLDARDSSFPLRLSHCSSLRATDWLDFQTNFEQICFKVRNQPLKKAFMTHGLDFI